MLTGRRLSAHRDRFFSPKLSPQDVKEAISTFKRMDEVVEILKALPSSMILVFRYAVFDTVNIILNSVYILAYDFLSTSYFKL